MVLVGGVWERGGEWFERRRRRRRRRFHALATPSLSLSLSLSHLLGGPTTRHRCPECTSSEGSDDGSARGKKSPRRTEGGRVAVRGWSPAAGEAIAFEGFLGLSLRRRSSPSLFLLDAKTVLSKSSTQTVCRNACELEQKLQRDSAGAPSVLAPPCSPLPHHHH